MYCLYCGDCCKRMSPISHPDPCPHLVSVDGFCVCSSYASRPKECVNHGYPSRFCPVGLDVLKLDPQDADRVRRRIDDGWGIIKGLTVRTA